MEGLLRALRQLDAVVATIRAAQDGPAAAAALRSNYQLSTEQVPPRTLPVLCVLGITRCCYPCFCRLLTNMHGAELHVAKRRVAPLLGLHMSGVAV